MKLSMNTQDLLDGLSSVSRALSARPVKQIMEGILLDARDQMVVLSCTNGSLSIECTLTASVQEEGKTVIPGRILLEFVRKVTDSVISLQSGAGGLRISSGNSRASFSAMNPDDFPEMPQMKAAVQVEVPQNQLRTLISSVVFAVALEESKPILTGCLFEVNTDEIRMVALDGYRLAFARLQQQNPVSGEPFKAVIPGKVLGELGRILLDEEDPCRLCFNQTHMEAVFGNTRISSVLLAGEYIEYQKILPTAYKTVVTLNREQLQASIERASLMAREGKNNLIKLSFRDEKLTINSSAEIGTVSDELPIRLEGENLDIAFNARYLQEIIKTIQEDEISLHLNSNVSPCVFMPVEGNSYLYLVLPVRVFQ